MDWQLAQKADEDALQEAALEALKASRMRPLTDDEVMTLGYAAGMANDVYREIRK